MKAISIRQPWAWLIVHGGKDIENRTWPTRYRGPVLIHAAQGMTRLEWESAWTFAQGTGASPKALAAGVTRDTIARGGFIGIADLIDCVPSAHRVSRWHMPGCFGFKLANAHPLPFTPYKGTLGLFDVPRESSPYRRSHMANPTCTRPPAGWCCTRAAGHAGPCAAWPEGSAALPVGTATPAQARPDLLDTAPKGAAS